MAPRNQNKANESVNETVDTPVEIVNENEKLKQEIEQLKQMMQQIINSQKNQAEETKEPTTMPDFDEEIAMIPPNKMTSVTSLFYGGMSLEGANNKEIRFQRFGMTRPVTFEDLTYICNNHRRLAEEGAFFIHNKDMVKALYLEDEYKKFLDQKTIENFITLPDEQIRKMFTGTTPKIQETIVDVFMEGVYKNLKGEQNKYNNRNKIELISELSGKNIYKLANDLLEQDK